MLHYTSAVVIGLLGLSLGGCSFSNFDRDLSQQASYNADANDTRSTYIVYHTEQLIKSCDMNVNDQIAASESVMELIVTEGVDRTTGQMKIDLDENVYNAGIRLLTLNVGIMKSTVTPDICRTEALSIRDELLAVRS